MIIYARSNKAVLRRLLELGLYAGAVWPSRCSRSQAGLLYRLEGARAKR